VQSFFKNARGQKNPVCATTGGRPNAGSQPVPINLTEIQTHVPGIPGYGAILFFEGIFRVRTLLYLIFQGGV
jgi:hypothetical protein